MVLPPLAGAVKLHRADVLPLVAVTALGERGAVMGLAEKMGSTQ